MLVLVVLATSMLGGGAAAGSVPPRPATPRPRAVHPVPFGPSPAAGLGRPIGASPDRAITVDFVLKAYAGGVVTASERQAVGGWLRRAHVRPRQEEDAVQVRARVDAVARLLRVRFSDYRLGGQTIYASTRPYVPSTVVADLEAILGLSDAPAATPGVVTASRSAHVGRATPPSPRFTSSPKVVPSACPAAAAAAGTTYYTLPEVGAHYGVSTLLAEGDQGAGVTIAALELAPSSPGDITTYDACFGLDPSSYSVQTVDPGESTTVANGTLEADLDIEQLQTQAPQAKVVSYEGPDTPWGYYDTLSAIVAADTAKVVSISWGSCEAAAATATTATTATAATTGYPGAIDQLLAKAAAQGQSVFAAAGDSGSEDCYGNASLPNSSTTLAVDFPASDANLTAVGGTTMSGAGDTVWNDCASASDSTCAQVYGAGGGGGGVSTLWPEPSWQQSVGSWPGRAVPDVSANAEPDMVFYDAAYGGWTIVGGTSAAAPLVAGMVADVVPTCATAIGNLAPRLYAYEGAYGYGTALADVTSGNNDLTDAFNHADYQAGAGYDLASGLGTPIATGLVCPTVASTSSTSAAPGSSITIAGSNLVHTSVTFGSSPATVTSASPTSLTVAVPNGDGTVALTVASPIGAAAPVSFSYPPVTFTSGSGTTFTAGQAGSFTVTTSGYSSPTLTETGNLPAGVSFVDNANGTATISGTPGSASGGVYTITIDAGDASGSSSQSFTLTVGAAPVSSGAAPAAASTTTTTTTPPPVPRVTVVSTSPAVSGVVVLVRVRCIAGSCAGAVALSSTRTLRVHKGRRVIRRSVRVLLGSARYSTIRGRTTVARVILNRTGRLALARAPRHRLVARETLSVRNGSTVGRRVVLTSVRRAPKRARAKRQRVPPGGFPVRQDLRAALPGSREGDPLAGAVG